MAALKWPDDGSSWIPWRGRARRGLRLRSVARPAGAPLFDNGLYPGAGLVHHPSVAGPEPVAGGQEAAAAVQRLLELRGVRVDSDRGGIDLEDASSAGSRRSTPCLCMQ